MVNQKSLRQFLSSQIASWYSKRPLFHSLDRSNCEIAALHCWRRNSPSTHQSWFESENLQSRYLCRKQSRCGSDSIGNDRLLSVRGCRVSRNAQHHSYNHRYAVLFLLVFHSNLNLGNFVDQWVRVSNLQRINCEVVACSTFTLSYICEASVSDFCTTKILDSIMKWTANSQCWENWIWFRELRAISW